MNWNEVTYGPERPALKRIGMQLSVIVFLLTTVLIGAFAGVSKAQHITLDKEKAPFEEVIKAIRQQSGYDFILKEEFYQLAKPVSIRVNDAPLEEVLQKVMANQDFSYKILEDRKTVVITEKGIVDKVKDFFTDGGAAGNEGAKKPQEGISGRVVDASGQPIAGVTVRVSGTRQATATDGMGRFSLMDIEENATLEVSAVGFSSLKLALEENGFVITTDQTKVDAEDQSLVLNASPGGFLLRLGKSTSPLDEVQVIAYGTQTQRFSVGNVNTVKSEDIEKQPVSNPLLALQSQVPGLFITQSTGLPGTGVKVVLQGPNSIGQGNDPLYVIDGAPYPGQLLRNLGVILGSSGNNVNSNGNPFSYISPSDIESISILKDADATAIYGSRAANGAILITTKAGRSGSTKINANVQNGFGEVGHFLQLMNTQQFLKMRHEAKANDNATVLSTDYDLNGVWDTTRSTNWQKTLIGKISRYSDYNTSVSGGTSNTQYYINGMFHRETTVFPGDFEDRKGSLHFNINNISNDRRFHIQLSGSYLVDKNSLPAADLTNQAVFLAPNAPPLYIDDGTLNWAPNSAGTSTWPFPGNPLAPLSNTYTIKANNLVSNAQIDYEIFSGLKILGNFGYTNLQTNEVQKFPLISTAPENRPTTNRSAAFGNNSISSWTIEPRLSYTKEIAKSRFDGIIGFSIQQSVSNGQQISGSGYNSDAILNDIKSASSISVPSTTYAEYKYNGVFVRLNYIYNDKYIIDVNARRDGSSRFGAANEFHGFGSVGLGWIFSQEDFVLKSLPFLSFGKLKASYGTTGNDQIGDYKFLSTYSSVSVGVPYQGNVGLSPTGLPNPYLQWELTKKLQLGLDLGFLNDRILLNSTYFRNRSSNQLLNQSLSTVTGFPTITQNFPATVQNSGFEFGLSTSNLQRKNFSWKTNFNLTIPDNKLIAFSNLENSSSAEFLIIGQPITLIKRFHLAGVNPSTGLYEFTDANGNRTSSPDALVDQTALLNSAPKFYGGIQNNVRFKYFQLDFSFQFVKQLGQNYAFGNTPGYKLTNQPIWLSSPWQKEGEQNSIQRLSSNYPFEVLTAYRNITASDAAFSDASYIRLKNLSFSWEIPEKWKNKLKLQDVSLYLQGQNLFTITNYKGLDPETLSYTTLPTLRVYTIGIKVTL